jgi:hypothetical protein
MATLGDWLKLFESDKKKEIVTNGYLTIKKKQKYK